MAQRRGKATTTRRTRGRATRRAARRPRPAARRAKKLAGGIAPGMPAVSAHLTVRDVVAAVDFYEKAFGFKRRNLMPGPEGKLMHAELTHRESVIMLGPESPGRQAPSRSGTNPTELYVYIEDVDGVTSRAKDAGATVAEEPKDQFWGDRTATVVDPEGHRWMLATFKKLIPFEEMEPPTA